MDSMDDDFEIEVTDLNTGASAHHPLADNMPNGADAPNNDDDNDDEGWPAPQSSGRSSSSRRHRLRAAIVTGVLALAVALVILINPTAKSSLYTVFHFPTPIPSPTPIPGANIVYLAHGAPWGNVTLDGKPVKNANLGMSIVWITIPRGRHTLAVTQAPFPAVRCVVSYPASNRDTCPLFSPDESQYRIDPSAVVTGSRFIDLGARFSQLSQTDQNALVAAARASLLTPDAPARLQPGDHYLRDDGSVAVARQPLLATFSPLMLAPTIAVESDDPSCVSFCDISGATIGGNATWNLSVSLLGSWGIATPNGQAIAQHAPLFPEDPIYTGMPATMQMQLSMLWTGRWQVSAYDQFGNDWQPVCQMAQQMMGAWLSETNTGSLSMNMLSGRTAEDGCVINMTLGDPTQGAPLYLYYHVGVLLAANDAAHQTFPKLPVASAAESTLARQILTGMTQP